MLSFMHDYIVTFHFSDDAVGKEIPFGISGYWALFSWWEGERLKWMAV